MSTVLVYYVVVASSTFTMQRYIYFGTYRLFPLVTLTVLRYIIA